MGNGISSRKVIPMNRPKMRVQKKYALQDTELIVVDKKVYITKKAYDTLYNDNINLKKKLSKLEKSDFECSICYNRNVSEKKKTRCKHDICISCFNIIDDKRCRICSIINKK